MSREERLLASHKQMPKNEERRFSLLTDSLIGQQRIVIWSRDQKTVTNDSATHEYLILRIDRFECPF